MENPLRGITLILAATMLFSISDAMAKVLGRTLPVFEISWIRYFIFVLMAFGLAGRTGRLRLRVRSPGLQILRGLSLVASAFFFVFALRLLPLADAAALGFISPLLITLLAIPMLGETVGIRRWAATIVGFIGVLIVVRPGAGTFEPGAIFVLLSSSSWAVASVLTRKMSGWDDAATTLLWSALTGFVVLSCTMPFVFVVPDAGDFALALLLGLVASTGQYLMVLAYRHAGASLLAPLSYAQLIWSSSLGFLVFATLPDRWTILGALIIVASGIYTAHRTRVRASQVG
jgi:drug/metabolite transporter (DMT)-like permease